MGQLLPKRIERLALLVPLVLAAFHLCAERQSSIGLDIDGGRTPALARLILQL